jgi:hypothetical protein
VFRLREIIIRVQTLDTVDWITDPDPDLDADLALSSGAKIQCAVLTIMDRP